MSRSEVTALLRFFRSFNTIFFNSYFVEKAAEVYEKLEKIGEKASGFDITVLGIMLHMGWIR